MGKGNSGCLEEGRRALERHLPISEDDSATGFQGYCFCDLTGRPVVSAGCALIDAYIDNGVWVPLSALLCPLYARAEVTVRSSRAWRS